MLLMRSLHSATVLPSNSYYTVVASIFLISAASCKAICRVALIRTSDYSQPFWLKRHALQMPHVLIKYAHVLICISAGEGSRHFSAIYYASNSTHRCKWVCLLLWLNCSTIAHDYLPPNLTVILAFGILTCMHV